ncbi:MAG: DUF5666 domain-containing protein [Caldilineaceae bacterium]
MLNTQKQKGSLSNVWIYAAMFVILAVLLVNYQYVYAAKNGTGNWRGTVSSRPEGGFVGTWTVGGKNFEADGNTQIDQQHGALEVGSCAQVDYENVGDVVKALRIQSKEAADCNETATATASPEPSETETPEGTATPEPTETETPEGTSTAEPTESETPEPSETPVCSSHGGDDQTRHDGGDSDCKTVGLITSLPADGLLGVWGIGTLTYTVNSDTELESEHGTFAENACVKVEYVQTANERVATQIQTEHSYRCGKNTDDHGRHGSDLYGVIESFPADLIGVWQVGSITFTTDISTTFVQEHGAFTVGMVVEVKFWTDIDGINYATKVEAKYKREDDGEDHNGDGSHDGAEGMAAGKVITMPENRIGVWVIGGIEYTVNSDTEFEEEHGELKVNAVVRVRYHENSAGARIADNIKALANAGQPNPGEDAHLAGSVDVMPSTGLSGTWQIAGVTFETDANTHFDEENSVLAVGSYVEVEYKVKDGVNLIIELKTQVPPGAGDKDDAGEIEKNDDSLSAAGADAVTTWIVGGKSYVVTTGTVLNTSTGSLAVGSTAVVNSYTAADGTQVATRIQGVTLNNRLFLPVLTR